jgi:hypothetical protein
MMNDLQDDASGRRRARRMGGVILAVTVGLPAVLLALWMFTEEVLNQPFWRGIFWEGADTQIVVVNLSGRDVGQFELRIADHQIRFRGALEARREDDPKQNEEMFWRPVRPLTFPIEIRYMETNTGITLGGSFVADRRPRRECKFVIFLEPNGPGLSECRRSDLEDFASS